MLTAVLSQITSMIQLLNPLSLDSTKVSQDSDIPRKIIKDNVDIFSDFLLLGFNNSITTSVIQSSLKQAILNKHQF